jgi:hypothetical protein
MIILKEMTITKQSLLACILIFIQVFNTLKSNSQSQKVSLNCDQIDKFINPHTQKPFFHGLPKGDSRLIFLDPENLLQKCKIDSWKNHAIEIINKSSGIDSFKTWDRHFVYRERCEYMLISTWRIKKETTLLLHHLCSNEFCSTVLKRKNGRYFISNLEGGVY